MADKSMADLEREARGQADRLATTVMDADTDDAQLSAAVLAGLGVVALCSIAASLERLTAVFAPVDGDA
jgi:hypothetical protein